MGNFLLPIGARVITKLGQLHFITNWGSFFFLQIGASVITNWGSLIIINQGSYYKLGQTLLQIEAAITNLGKLYYKLGQLLQIGAIITNWGITTSSMVPILQVYLSFFMLLGKCLQYVHQTFATKNLSRTCLQCNDLSPSKGCSSDIGSSYFSRPSKVRSMLRSMLHHWSVKLSSEENKTNLTLTLNLLLPSIVFYNKIRFFIMIFTVLSFLRFIYGLFLI